MQSRDTSNNPGLVWLDTVKPEKVEWLWYPYIPLRKVTLLDGDPGQGKSLLTTDISSRITSNQTMPDGSKGIGGGVVFLALEDGLADTIIPRIEVAGGDRSKIVALQGVPDGPGKLRLPTVQDVVYIANACDEANAKLVIIDPLMGYIGKANSWKDQEIRSAMAPLVKMADDQNVAVIVVRHLNKSVSLRSIYRGGGSIAFIGLARVGLLCAEDPDNEDKHVLAGIKSNLGPLPPSLSYAIEVNGGIAKIAWGGRTSHKADDLLAVDAMPEGNSALDDAEEFLNYVLKDGPVEALVVTTEAETAGISKRTLDRAKRTLGVKSEKSKFDGRWKWVLPSEDCQEKPKVANKNNGNLGGTLATFDSNSPKMTKLAIGENEDQSIKVNS
jgi:hypothetical protein